MNAAEIRIRLYDYIRVADDKKIRALYAILEGSTTEDLKWEENIALLNGLDKSIANFIANKDKGYSFINIKSSIVQRKNKTGK